MADILLSPVLKVIFDRLASPIFQKIGDMWDLKENCSNLQNTLLMVQAVLEDAEEKQVTNKAVRIWLSRLKDTVYDAEDLLDEFTGTFIISKPSGLVNFYKKIRTRAKAKKLRNMMQELERTAMEGFNLHLREVSIANRQSDRRESGSFVIESEIYGRMEDKEKIVKLLLSCEAAEEGNVSFVPIIGIGGLGKTTLAQLAYNDEEVARHFDINIWVFVSDYFDVKSIIKAIIESVTKDKCGISEMDVLQSKLWALLHKKRYLIVLDDVWNEDQEEWDKLTPLFRGCIVGSKIIVTTRSSKVAFMKNSPTFPYYLKGLPDDDCWNLFKQRAFRQREEQKFPKLSLIGKQIVKKCGGVPLAVKTLGSLLRFKIEEKEWLFVQNSELWDLDVCKSGILPALRLSYIHLPSHLKHCFAFCSVFSKNYEIEKEKLIRLWMAEGLIQSDVGSKQPEEIGNDYFNDLLWMSFFQELEHYDNGGLIRYKMLDIIHDLAQSVAGKESMTLGQGPPSSNLVQTRHSSVFCSFTSSMIPEALYKAEHLRTLLLFPVGDFKVAPGRMYKSFLYLRVLDLNACGLEELDQSIGGLLCLRYLDLSYARITKLPNSIEILPFLQTLNLFTCYRLRALPNIAEMVSLRHLNTTGCVALTSMVPLRYARRVAHLLPNIWPGTNDSSIREIILPKITNQLQTLPMVVVSCVLDLEILGRLNLQGELTIKGLKNVKNAYDSKLANMMQKENLESLSLCWGSNDDHHTSSSQEYEQDAELGEQVIQGLKPHQNLKKLFAKGFPGIRFPRWTLPNLTSVHFTKFMNCERLPTLGNRLLLKTLSLCGMNGVRDIGKEFYGEGTGRPFSSLEELVLDEFTNLEEWFGADDGDAFPSLSKLIVKKCPKLTAMPLLPSLQHLELRDCSAVIFDSIGNVSSLTVLVIQKVTDLLSISGSFLASNPLLKSLEIISCPRLRSLPSELGNLYALKSLTIRWCEDLFSLPHGLQNLKALEYLEITDCHGLISLPEGGFEGLTALRTLSIENCSKLTSLSTSLQHLTSLEHFTLMYSPLLGSSLEGFEHLSALRSMTILNCSEFFYLPEGLQKVTTLHCLEIGSCPGFTDLPEWIGCLASLKSLAIYDCHNLKQLPEGLKVLAALQHLSIQECPELEERCKKEIGEDWQKIIHIPHNTLEHQQ